LFAYLWQLPAMTGWLAVATVAGKALGEQAFAFLGAMFTIAIVFVLASRRGRLEPITLLLVGVIVNAVNGSIFLLINALPGIKDPATAGGPLRFLVGGLQTNLTTPQKLAATMCISAGWIVIAHFSGQLNAALLSEGEAQSLGVRIHRLRWIGLLVASLITASAVAVSGPIGFIGLVCPHLARLIVGNDQRRLLPLATALGAGLLAVADALSRALSRPGAAETLLPVGVITGLLGGPFFLMLLWQKRRTMSL
jgi:iron complex transport system permease protein